MIIIIPFCKRDYKLVVNLLKNLKHFKLNNNYEFVFLFTQKEEELSGKVKSTISKVCPNNTIISLGLEQIYPAVVNLSFAYACQFAHELQRDFLFLEPDCIMLHELAFDCMYQEFLDKQGLISGQIAYDFKNAGGLYNNGVAVYDKDVIKHFKSIKICPPNIAFDLFCRYEFLTRLAPSQFIKCYTAIDNVENLHDVLNGSEVLFHGCKDTSLNDLVIKNDYKTTLHLDKVDTH